MAAVYGGARAIASSGQSQPLFAAHDWR